ncbi:hypothetical protein NE237_030859 [Protea cynaroides]|uniref:procollagen-proline 4-dioxygenase n=1 Tax=Protea cynaroides TaxID=273540 RepID=A0A9Q0GXZ9_9MAGN|nr:hypothetical protein NE237_030859 [Protea cynaroides]
MHNTDLRLAVELKYIVGTKEDGNKGRQQRYTGLKKHQWTWQEKDKDIALDSGGQQAGINRASVVVQHGSDGVGNQGDLRGQVQPDLMPIVGPLDSPVTGLFVNISMASLLSVSLLLGFLCAALWSCPAESYRKELRTKEVEQEAIIQLGRSMQFTRIDPSRVIQLSWRPRVFLYRDFLFDEECDHLIYLAHEKLERSSANDSDSREAAMSDLNSSSGTATNVDQDDTIAKIEDRISAWSFLPKENGKPLEVLHYGIEETKQPDDHNDDKSRLAVDEPVMATVVLYLSNVTQGGETIFPKSEFESAYPRDITLSDCAKTSSSVRPLKGNALLIFNLHPNTTPDVSSSYARCPVIEGDQWFATKSFLLRATEVKKSSESDSTDCTDEEENCPHWAVIGECQRNPVYMIGSPDYYGSCRKSCKAC